MSNGGGGGGFDPCECILSHEYAMRRLISLLQNSQSYCTDSECFEELPGPSQTGASTTATDGGGFNLVLFFVAWIVVALTLYLMRPHSTRPNVNNRKPHNQGPHDRAPPPPPPDANVH